MDVLAPGDRFGRYKILEVIGRGGSATVYRVFSPQVKGIAALKISSGPTDDADAAARSLREVAVVRTLTNRHVPRIYDAGRSPDGHVYICMEMLEGMQLNHWHDFDEPMPCGQAVSVIHQACLGLGEAHAHGIVHRDIKPENLWVEPDHNVKVLDFGLARSWDHEEESIGANVTMTNMVMGTPRYMQPEQLHTTKLTPASDVYSLGTILYELLVGHSVFFADQPFSEIREKYRSTPMVWLGAHADDPPVPLSHYAVARSFPESLEALVLRCLAKKPDDRPRDAVSLANALGEILHYDMGVVTAATLRKHLPAGTVEEQLVLPGSMRIGSAPVCEIHLDSELVPQLLGILSWNGAPDFPELRILVPDIEILCGGLPVKDRADLGPNDTIEVAGFELQFDWPPA